MNILVKLNLFYKIIYLLIFFIILTSLSYVFYDDSSIYGEVLHSGFSHSAFAATKQTKQKKQTAKKAVKTSKTNKKTSSKKKVSKSKKKAQTSKKSYYSKNYRKKQTHSYNYLDPKTVDHPKYITSIASTVLPWETSDPTNTLEENRSEETSILDKTLPKTFTPSTNIPNTKEEPERAYMPGRGGVVTGNAERLFMLYNPKIISQRVEKVRTFSQYDLFSVNQIKEYDWMPDGRSIAFIATISGAENIYLLDVTGMSWPHQLTFRHRHISNIKVDPSGKYILFLESLYEGAPKDIHIYSLEKGESKPLTNTPLIDESEASWDPNGSKIAYISTSTQNSTVSSIIVSNLSSNLTLENEQIYSSGSWKQNSLKWKPTGESILISRIPIDKLRDSHLVIVNLDKTETVLISLQEGQKWQGVDWSPKGDYVLATSDYSGCYNIAVINVQTQNISWVTDSNAQNIAQDWAVSANLIAWVTQIPGNYQLYVGSPNTSRSLVPLGIRRGMIQNVKFSPNSRYVAFHHATTTRSSDIWIYDLVQQKSRPVTFSMPSNIQQHSLVEPFFVSYKTFDARIMGGFLYIPHNLPPESKQPSIIWIPDPANIQQYHNYKPEIQYLVNQGFVVLVPYYRGCEGFGRAFESLRDSDWGGGDLQDILSAGEYIKKIQFVNPEQVSIVGEGYGAYLAMLLTAKYNSLWMSAVEISGMFDLLDTYESLDDQHKIHMSFEMGNPKEKEILWKDRSPMYFLKNIQTPLLTISGLENNEQYVKKIETYLNILSENNVTVKNLVYPYEYNSISHWQTRMDMTVNILSFLKKQIDKLPTISSNEAKLFE